MLQCVSLFPVLFSFFFVTPVLCVRTCVVYFVCSAGQQTKLLVLFLLNFVFFWLMPLTVFCFHWAWGSTQRLENVILLLITAITDSEQDWDRKVCESGGERGVCEDDRVNASKAAKACQVICTFCCCCQRQTAASNWAVAVRARRKPLRVKHAPPAPTELRPRLLPSVPAPSVQVAAAAAGSSTDNPGRKEAGGRERERLG